MDKGKAETWMDLLEVVFVIALIALAAVYVCAPDPKESEPDAVVLTKAGAVTAQWNYQQLEMKECKWCGRTVNLNRHHEVPQAANPALRDVKENLIILCRDCHFVLGHRCNWKQYNPDAMYIATHFTNCVKSEDTRAEIKRPAGGPFTPPDPDWRNAVTNKESLDEAIGRLFDGTESKHTD